MKKISSRIGFAGVAALFFLSGCASTKNITLEEKSPMAVISVIGTNLVAWQEQTQNDSDETLTTDGAFNALLNKAIDGKNPEIATAVDRLDYADESFRRVMAETANVKILEKSNVVDTDVYEYTRGSFYNSLSDSVCATGYKDMTVIGAKKARILESGLGAKSLASMDFSFKKTVIKGNRQNGKLAALVVMKIKILDERGREFINKEYSGVSAKTTPILSGYYKKEELLSLINETIDDLITQFAVEFSGDLAIKSDVEADSENAEKTELAAEENANQKDESADTSDISGESVPAASAKLGKPKSSAKNVMPENTLDGAAANVNANAASPSESGIANMSKSEKDAVLLQAENTARSLLKMGLDCEKISVATGLPIERVKEIQNEIQKELQNNAQN